MDGVRAASQSGVRRPTDPKKELFGWMCIQAVAIGLGVAGMLEAHRDDDQAWGVILMAVTACVLYNYFWCAWTWASWWAE